MGRLSENSTLKELLGDKKAKAVLKKHFGNIIESPLAKKLQDKTLREVYIALPAKFSKEEFKRVIEELGELSVND